ncbi:MAG: ABC transporter permease, partial [Pyrinomonadaceae bacterium]
MRKIFENLRNNRLWPLFVKEYLHLKRNRRLVITLIIPPTIQIVIFGLALNPEVTNLRLGVVDESRTSTSRELISAFTESQTFQIVGYYASPDGLEHALSAGELDAGLVLRYDFAKQRARRETAEAQLLVDAVDSNRATIASGYASRIINSLNQRIAQAQPPPVPMQSAEQQSQIQPLSQSTPVTPALGTSGTSATSDSNADAGSATPEVSTPSGSLPTTTTPEVTVNELPSPAAPVSITTRVALFY